MKRMRRKRKKKKIKKWKRTPEIRGRKSTSKNNRNVLEDTI